MEYVVYFGFDGLRRTPEAAGEFDRDADDHGVFFVGWFPCVYFFFFYFFFFFFYVVHVFKSVKNVTYPTTMSVSSCDPFDVHVRTVMREFGPATIQPTCPDIGADGELVSCPGFHMCVHGLYYGLDYSLNVLRNPADEAKVNVSLCFRKNNVEPDLGSCILSVETDRLAGFEQEQAVDKTLDLCEFTPATLKRMFELASGVGLGFTVRREVWELMQEGGFEGGVVSVIQEDGIYKLVVSGLRRLGVFVKVVVSIDFPDMYDLRVESLGQVVSMRACHMTPLLAAAREMVVMHQRLLGYPPAAWPPAMYPNHRDCPLLYALRANGFVGGRHVTDDPSEWKIVNALYYGVAVQVHFTPFVSASLIVNGLTVRCVFSQGATLEKTISDFVDLASVVSMREKLAIVAEIVAIE